MSMTVNQKVKERRAQLAKEQGASAALLKRECVRESLRKLIKMQILICSPGRGQE